MDNQVYPLKHQGCLVCHGNPARQGIHILICPGGGYAWLSPREGAPVAAAFLKAGLTPWVLHYKVGTNLGQIPMRQMAQALSIIKAQSGAGKVVACGFSAGAHLVASLGVHGHSLGLPVQAAQILCYPVITTDARFAHSASMQRLALNAEQAFYSVENYVNSNTPPSFIWHTADDSEVPVQNSLLFAQKLAMHNVPFALHIFPHGVHGLSLATSAVEEKSKKRFANPHVAQWFALSLQWIDMIFKGE